MFYDYTYMLHMKEKEEGEVSCKYSLEVVIFRRCSYIILGSNNMQLDVHPHPSGITHNSSLSCVFNTIFNISERVVYNMSVWLPRSVTYFLR